MTEHWKKDAIALAKTGVMSWRAIAKHLGISKSSVSDWLRGKDLGCGNSTSYQEGTVHMFIPDSQVKPGIDMSFLSHIGEYIVRKRPDVIIHAGDFADMESLSLYDKGKRTAEGKRVYADIRAAEEGMMLLLAPLHRLQSQQRVLGEPIYSPRMVMTLGNHEHRLERYVNDNPELHGTLGIHSLGYDMQGWEVIPFLKPITIDGVSYCHYFTNNMTGKPLGGSAAAMLKTIGTSFSMGHRQTLDVATRFLAHDGQQQWGLIAGAGYSHDEDYKGYQGNHHWRGVVVKHNVKNGSYDPLFVSLEWLEKKYGKRND